MFYASLCRRFIAFILDWPLSATEPPSWVGVGFSIVWILLLANLVVAIRSKKKQTIYDYLVASIVVDT